MNEWYQIRNIFLGLNHQTRNFRRALLLARTSTHPMSTWLAGLFIGKSPKTKWEVLFELERHANDAEAHTFIGILHDNYESILEGATRGSILAQSYLLTVNNFQWLDNVRANHNDDPVVLYNVANMTASNVLLRRSAELGYIDAMIDYSRRAYDLFDVRKLHWYTDQVFQVSSGRKAINRLLAHYPDIPNQFLYHLGHLLKVRNGGTHFIRNMAETAKSNCSRAVSAWLICARKLNIVRDMRCLIGTMLWKSAWRWIEKEDYLEQCKIEQFFKRLKNEN